MVATNLKETGLMILKVDTFKDGVTEQIENVYDAHELDLEFIDLHYLKKVRLEGFAEKIQQTVTFRGKFTSRIEQVCARCLETIQSDVSTRFDLSYDIQGQETIDTTSDLRDILILNHPDRFLCSPNCHGICIHCGTNLNKGSCRCNKVAKVVAIGEQLKDKFDKKEN